MGTHNSSNNTYSSPGGSFSLAMYNNQAYCPAASTHSTTRYRVHPVMPYNPPANIKRIHFKKYCKSRTMGEAPPNASHITHYTTIANVRQEMIHLKLKKGKIMEY